MAKLSRAHALLNRRDTDLAELIRRHSYESVIAETGWLDLDDNLEALYSDARRIYLEYRASLIELLGEPLEPLEPEGNGWPDFYDEAFELTIWNHPGGRFFLGAVHHDRETPVLVCCGFRVET